VRPKFLADADFNYKIISGLRRREPSLDFMSAQEGDVIRRADPEVLRMAALQGRILVSHDRNTMTRHSARLLKDGSSPGLIIVAQDMDIGEAIEDLLLIWTASDAAEWKDTIGFVPI
jgi:hypothetical protein